MTVSQEDVGVFSIVISAKIHDFTPVQMTFELVVEEDPCETAEIFLTKGLNPPTLTYELASPRLKQSFYFGDNNSDLCWLQWQYTMFIVSSGQQIDTQQVKSGSVYLLFDTQTLTLEVGTWDTEGHDQYLALQIRVSRATQKEF